MTVFHDDTTRPPRSTVDTINAFHNRLNRDLDVSVHFNAVAGGTRDAGIGVETLYRAGNAAMRNLAGRVSQAISDASGLILRHTWREVAGTVPRSDLGFLTRTNINNAILLEVCFVNSRTDVQLYQQHFDAICHSIAEALIGRRIVVEQPEQHWPISEVNLQALQRMGIMNSPDYWRTVSLQWLNELLTNVVKRGVCPKAKEQSWSVPDGEIAVKELARIGIIGSPDYWFDVVAREEPRFINALLINIANKVCQRT